MRLLLMFFVLNILIPFSMAQYADLDYADVLQGPRGIEVLIVNTDPERSRFDGSSSDEVDSRTDSHEERGLAAGYGDDHDDPHATEPHFNDFGDDVRYGVVAGGDDPEAHFNDYDNARPVDRNNY